jgi:aspartyl/asparaginyl-tRNA synthetase
MTITAPRQWRNPEKHMLVALESDWYPLMTGLMSLFVTASHDFFRTHGIRPVLAPVTTNAVSSPMGLGSDSVPVRVELHGRHTYLADSMQFQLELLLRHGGRGVYYVMPTFRGEDHDETHLNQFFHAEAEIIGDLPAVVTLIENYVRHLCHAVVSDPIAHRLRRTGVDIEHLTQFVETGTAHRVTHAEAVELLAELAEPGHTRTTATGHRVVTRSGETELMRRIGAPLWLTDPPAPTVPFYQQIRQDGTAAAADLLVPFGGEIVGCGARHADAGSVRTALAAHRVAPEAYGWYLVMKERRPMHTAGFGMGVERFLLWVLRHDDIRDLHVMPRLKEITCVP